MDRRLVYDRNASHTVRVAADMLRQRSWGGEGVVVVVVAVVVVVVVVVVTVEVCSFRAVCSLLDFPCPLSMSPLSDLTLLSEVCLWIHGLEP